MIDSTWLIGTDRSAAEIRDHLLQHIDHNDALFVGRLSGEAAWYGLAVDGTNWLKGQLAA
ncbi:MAG TPA: hypothetical protein VN908_12470 [Gemmatimonadales bacterium]|nr:hypothetical protein [Gemmatimonadales bacterium]